MQKFCKRLLKLCLRQLIGTACYKPSHAPAKIDLRCWIVFCGHANEGTLRHSRTTILSLPILIVGILHQPLSEKITR